MIQRLFVKQWATTHREDVTGTKRVLNCYKKHKISIAIKEKDKTE